MYDPRSLGYQLLPGSHPVRIGGRRGGRGIAEQAGLRAAHGAFQAALCKIVAVREREF